MDAWFAEFKESPQYKTLLTRPIAYFCAEYVLDAKLPTYAGGLGVLAGDLIREASDQEIPFVGVGLAYQATNPDLLKEVIDASGNLLTVTVPMHDVEVKVKVWRFNQGVNAVFLLDSNVSGNAPEDQKITEKIYVGDKETRLKQEFILGIGGFRVLEALGIHPSIYHLNEGHSAFLAYELTRHQMQERQINFAEAQQFVKRRIVFTNHTLVAAGHEIYSSDLVALMFYKYSQEIGVPVNDLVKLGLVQDSTEFSLTILCLRVAGVINAVSKLHATKAREIWTDHPMVGITNGIHIPSWDGAKNNSGLVESHKITKETLITQINKLGRNWQTTDLVIGWARRFVQYKRPLAILEDLARLKSICSNVDRPVRIVLSGMPHANDTDGKNSLDKALQLIETELKDIAIYLPNYDVTLAKSLVSGCDVWLNTPIVGFEACGTSGMKASLNGCLPCSTRDGWVAEVEMFKIGWILDSDKLTNSLLDILEKEIIPMYYNQTIDWQEHMNNARQMVLNQFSMTRVLKEYIKTLYI